MIFQRKLAVFFQKLTWSLVIWILAAFLFGYIRVWGVESLPSFERVLPFEPVLFPFYMITLGLAIGIPFGIHGLLLRY